MDKRLTGDEIVDDKPSKTGFENNTFSHHNENHSDNNEDALAIQFDEEVRDNPLDAIIMAQLGELEGRLNAQFAALVTRLDGLEIRIEDRCRELHDRISLSSLPPGDPGEQTRQLLQSIQLLQLDSRRVTAELADLRRNAAPASVPDLAALVAAAVIGSDTRIEQSNPRTSRPA